MKKIVMLISAIMFATACAPSVSASTSSFKISGTVFNDENGNGLRDGNETQFISSARSCKKSLIVKGTKIKVIAKKGKSSKTNYYSLDYCGMRTKGQYSGFGVYYDTKTYEEGTNLTLELIVPDGWKSTWPNPVAHKVESEYYIDFAMTKVVPAPIEQKEKVVTSDVNAGNSSIAAVNPAANTQESSQSEIEKQIKIITQEQDASKEKVAQSIDKIEKRNKMKTFFFGSDYENLGDLRSEMVKTRNQIDQLKRLADKADNDKEKVDLLTQIQTLQQKQTSIDGFITQNESKFSLFGWLVKLF